MKTLIIPENLDLKQYFRDHDLAIISEEANRSGRNVNEMQVDSPYRPELTDLYRLHRFVLDKR